MFIPHENSFLKLKSILESKQKFLIISHRGPDGDTVGCNLALRHVLEKIYLKKVVSACFDPLSPKYNFLPGTEFFVTDFDLAIFDAIITVDTATESLLKFPQTKPELLAGKIPIINLDHHQDNTGYGTENIVSTEAATAILLYHFFRYLKLPLDPLTATYLLTGIYYDTGGLMHSNTTASVYRIAADLISQGGNFKRISKNLFHVIPYNRLKLWGKILERMYQDEDNVVISAVLAEDLYFTNTEPEDASGLIDYLNMVKGAKYSLLLNEDKKGLVKGSLRTLHDNVNVSEVAHRFGGGGHTKASGFAIPGKLVQEIRWKVIN